MFELLNTIRPVKLLLWLREIDFYFLKEYEVVLMKFCLKFFSSRLVLTEFDPICPRCVCHRFCLSVYRSSPLDKIALERPRSFSRTEVHLLYICSFQGPTTPCLASIPDVSETVSSRVAETCNDFLPFLTLENKSSELDKISRIAVDAIRVLWHFRHSWSFKNLKSTNINCS